MTSLHLDLVALTAAASRTDQIRTNFAAAQSVAHDVAGLTGHDGLAGRVREFADSWDVSRERLSEGLEFLGEALRAVVDTFSELDGALAARVAATDGHSGGGGR